MPSLAIFYLMVIGSGVSMLMALGYFIVNTP